MQVRLWGVRGSTPTPQMDNLGFGGNTACIEVRSDSGQLVILDGGTGLRNLGQGLLEGGRGPQQPVHLFLTHYHWDHIQGIPFFLPLYRSDTEVTFYAHAELGNPRDLLQGQMSKPYFPVSIDIAAPRGFHRITEKAVRIGDLTICPFPLNHPQGAYGYRIESGGQAVVYASDLEHGHPQLDAVLREYATGADILIYDAQYTPEEYPSRKGWGHSTWLEGTRVAREAGVRQLILSHHDPWHNDQALLEIGRKARTEFAGTLVASEGWVADLSSPHWRVNACLAGV